MLVLWTISGIEWIIVKKYNPDTKRIYYQKYGPGTIDNVLLLTQDIMERANTS